MKLPERSGLEPGCGIGKRLRSLLAATAFLMLSLPLQGQTVVHLPTTAAKVPMVRPSVNPVRVVPQVVINRPAVNPSLAMQKVQIPRVSVNAPKINLGPSSYYAGYPYGYVPYNSRFFYPPYNGHGLSATAGQTGVGNAVGTSQARAAGTSSNSLLGSPPRHNFQYDDREVLAVQTALRRLGYYTGSLDGILGPDTQAAIENYQAAKKQPVTGFIDRATLSTLGVITNN
jgi:hypothetical protein